MTSSVADDKVSGAAHAKVVEYNTRRRATRYRHVSQLLYQFALIHVAAINAGQTRLVVGDPEVAAGWRNRQPPGVGHARICDGRYTGLVRYQVRLQIDAS